MNGLTRNALRMCASRLFSQRAPIRVGSYRTPFYNTRLSNFPQSSISEHGTLTISDSGQVGVSIAPDATRRMSHDNNKDELRKRLTPLQWHVTQEKGTERPFSGTYNKFYEKGTYTCVVCEQELFSSDTKYDSGCGWPAFNEVLDQGRVKLTKDTSNVGGNLLLLIANPDMVRTEVTCSRCGSHLGHVFNDGPKPTRKRFCINSASINFHEAGEKKNST